MLGVALTGVVVNLAATWLLARARGAGRRRSLNMEGAAAHVLTDLYAFAATVVAGFVILLSATNWYFFIDPMQTQITQRQGQLRALEDELIQ